MAPIELDIRAGWIYTRGNDITMYRNEPGNDFELAAVLPVGLEWAYHPAKALLDDDGKVYLAVTYVYKESDAVSYPRVSVVVFMPPDGYGAAAEHKVLVTWSGVSMRWFKKVDGAFTVSLVRANLRTEGGAMAGTLSTEGEPVPHEVPRPGKRGRRDDEEDLLADMRRMRVTAVPPRVGGKRVSPDISQAELEEAGGGKVTRFF